MSRPDRKQCKNSKHGMLNERYKQVNERYKQVNDIIAALFICT